jgi:hypothetical protein
VTAIPRILILVSLAALVLLAGCGSSGSTPVQQKTLAIALNPPPSSTTVPVGDTTGIQFTAVVSNDPGANGVDWAITCTAVDPDGGPNCGSLNISNLHTASDAAVNYLPPAVVPYDSNGQVVGSQTVNITAFATADHSKNVTTTVTVSSYVNVLNGTYVFQVQGSDANAYPYQATGAITLDGTGNITSGKQTFNSVFGFSRTVDSTQVNPAADNANYFAGSTYFIGPDGRGTITLSNLTDDGGNLTSETFSLVVLSSSQAMIAELDSNSSVGTLELQDSTAATTLPTGSYAFVANGVDSGGDTVDKNGPIPIAFGGVLSIDSSGNISGAGSLADEEYNKKFISCPVNTGILGTVSQPGAFGTVLITVAGQPSCQDSDGLSAMFGPAQFLGYIVDATHIRIIENDDPNGSGGYLAAGLAVGQGSAAGTFTNASFSGPFVFGVLGANTTSINAPLTPSSLTSVGVVNPNGSGALTGYTDTFLQLIGNGNGSAQVSSPFTGTYQTDPTGRTLWSSLSFNKAAFKPEYVAYLTGNGTAPLVLYGEHFAGNLASVGTGIAYPQAPSPSTLSFGNPEAYGVSFTQQNGTETDGTAHMTATSAGISGSLAGAADDFNGNLLLNYAGTGPLTLADTFTLPADSFGRITGTFLNDPTVGAGPYVNYYLADNDHGFVVETDALDPVNPTGQVALGYFAPACDVTSTTSCQQAARKFGGRVVKRNTSHKTTRK